MKINTEIREVQIYRNRCTVIRGGMIPLKAGLNQVEISGMSPSAMIDTVRMNFPPFIKTGMIRVIEGRNGLKTEELSGKIRRIESKKKALKEQAQMWKPEEIFRHSTEMSLKDLEACIRTYPLRMEEIENKIQDLDNKKASLEKQLRQAVEEERRPLVQAELIAESDVHCFFEMSYQDGSAGWYPRHEIHADTGNSDARFVMKANIYQNTAEDWNQVKLRIHTGNPVFFHSMPKLDPVYLNLRSDETPVVIHETIPIPALDDTAGDWNIDGNWNTDMTYGGDYSLKVLDVSHVKIPEDHTVGGLVLPFAYTVLSGFGEGFSCDLLECPVHAEYIMKAIPKLNSQVYLCAQLKRDDMPVLINGWAGVYFNGIYTANVYLDTRFNDEPVTVPLGVMERISVSREERKQKDSDAMIRNLRSTDHEININVLNNEENDISLEITDQIPVSADREIHVELLDCGQAVYDSSDGTLRWKLDVKPQQSRTVHAQYRVLQPKDREIEMPHQPKIVIDD